MSLTAHTVAASRPAAADESAAPAEVRRSPIRAVLGGVRDGIAAIPALLTDCAVLAFALWTLLYHAALPLGLAPSLTLRIWLIAGSALAVLAVLLRLALRWRRRRTAQNSAAPRPPPTRRTRQPRRNRQSPPTRPSRSPTGPGR